MSVTESEANKPKELQATKETSVFTPWKTTTRKNVNLEHEHTNKQTLDEKIVSPNLDEKRFSKWYRYTRTAVLNISMLCLVRECKILLFTIYLTFYNISQYI